MSTDTIQDRGRGPEIAGTRITVYHLLPYFLDSTATEEFIGRLHELTPEQVAAARAYVLNHPETVLAEHLKLEDRIAAGNPPEVIERATKTHDEFLRFKQWLAQRAAVEAREQADEDQEPPDDRPSGSGPNRFPTFREWLAAHEARPAERS